MNKLTSTLDQKHAQHAGHQQGRAVSAWPMHANKSLVFTRFAAPTSPHYAVSSTANGFRGNIDLNVARLRPYERLSEAVLGQQSTMTC